MILYFRLHWDARNGCSGFNNKIFLKEEFLTVVFPAVIK